MTLTTPPTERRKHRSVAEDMTRILGYIGVTLLCMAIIGRIVLTAVGGARARETTVGRSGPCMAVNITELGRKFSMSCFWPDETPLKLEIT